MKIKQKEVIGSGDDFFKAVMFSKKGKRILEQIIGQVLGKRVEIIEFINTELGKTQSVEKGKRVDVIVRLIFFMRLSWVSTIYTWFVEKLEV